MKLHPVKIYQLSDHYYFVMILHCFCRWDHYLSHKDVPRKKTRRRQRRGAVEKNTNKSGGRNIKVPRMSLIIFLFQGRGYINEAFS